MADRSSGQYGNRYVQRGFAQEFGQEGFDQGKYSIGPVPHVGFAQTNGQGYNLGWNGFQGTNVLFNPYQKIGYAGYQNQGFNGGQLGLANGAGQLLFGGAPQQQQAVNFLGNQRFRIL